MVQEKLRQRVAMECYSAIQHSLLMHPYFSIYYATTSEHWHICAFHHTDLTFDFHCTLPGCSWVPTVSSGISPPLPPSEHSVQHRMHIPEGKLPIRSIEWPGLKRITTIIWLQPPAMCRVTNQQTRLPRATSSLALNASRDGASTASLGNLFQLSAFFTHFPHGETLSSMEAPSSPTPFHNMEDQRGPTKEVQVYSYEAEQLAGLSQLFLPPNKCHNHKAQSQQLLPSAHRAQTTCGTFQNCLQNTLTGFAQTPLNWKTPGSEFSMEGRRYKQGCFPHTWVGILENIFSLYLFHGLAWGFHCLKHSSRAMQISS